MTLSTPTTDTKDASDGRLQRTTRRRKTIVNAYYELVNSGNLIPTAQQVADRSGVTIRTIFRYFPEMDQLYAELDKSLRTTYESSFLDVEISGSLEARLRRAVSMRADIYIEMSMIALSVQCLAWRSPVIRNAYARNQGALAENLLKWLPELKEVPEDIREVIVAMTSFEFWNRLHTRQGMPKEAAIDVIVKMVLSSLAH